MADKLFGTDAPRPVERKGTTRIAEDPKGGKTRRTKAMAQCADRIVADHVLSTRDRKGGDWNAAGEGLKLRDAERIGSAWRYENVARSEVRSEHFMFYQAKEFGFREPVP